MQLGTSLKSTLPSYIFFTLPFMRDDERWLGPSENMSSSLILLKSVLALLACMYLYWTCLLVFVLALIAHICIVLTCKYLFGRRPCHWRQASALPCSTKRATPATCVALPMLVSLHAAVQGFCTCVWHSKWLYTAVSLLCKDFAHVCGTPSACTLLCMGFAHICVACRACAVVHCCAEVEGSTLHIHYPCKQCTVLTAFNILADQVRRRRCPLGQPVGFPGAACANMSPKNAIQCPPVSSPEVNWYMWSSASSPGRRLP